MVKKIPYLKTATALPGYKLMVNFEDGVSGVVDLKTWVGKGLFRYWNDESNFEKFIISTDKKLEWTEEIDMDPEAFYLQLTGKTFESYTGSQQLLRDAY